MPRSARPRNRRVYRLAGPASSSWIPAWLARVARALAAARPGTGVLVEWAFAPELGSPSVCASHIAFEPSLVAAARGLPVELDHRVALRSGLTPHCEGGELWAGVLVPGRGEAGFDSDTRDDLEKPHAPSPTSGLVPELPEVGPRPERLGDGRRVGLQSHWFASGDGRVRLRLRLLVEARDDEAEPARAAIGLALAERTARLRLGPASVAWRPAGRRFRRAWTRGTLLWPTSRAVWTVSPAEAARMSASVRGPQKDEPGPEIAHTVVFGASGSGKSGYLVARGVEAIRRGETLLAIDVHGDLAPAVVAALPASARDAVVAVDPTGSPDVPGVPLLGDADTGRRDAEAAHLVAALRRLSVAESSGEVYWGFRLERIFGAFVRVVQEEGGDLRDLAALLTDARRREAARLAVRDPDARRFLDELPDILRRNPEFLAPAAARVTRLLAAPRLAAVLVPRGSALDLPRCRARGESVLWRMPIGEFGPEAASLVATLLLTHAFLALARLAAPSAPVTHDRRSLVLLDEAHLVSPRILAELLAEGRKFGIEVVLATQYPERLAPEVRAAARGAAGTHLLFRTPWPGAAETGAWAGLAREEAERLLPALPVGVAVRVRSGVAASRELVRVSGPNFPDAHDAWARAIERTRERFPREPEPEEPESGSSSEDPAMEALLLALVGAEVDGGLAPSILVERAAELLGRTGLGEALERALETLRHRGWVRRSDSGTVEIQPAGRAFLGLGVRSGATREGAEHRALLAEAFRVFARRGYRLELVRQGRFDTQLPDARLRLVAPGLRAGSPHELARALDLARRGWAWLFFGGRDVHVEAEVSGALRPDRIRRGVRKAERANAYALFLVTDARRARRVRAALRALGVRREQAGVWTLSSASGSGRGISPGDPIPRADVSA